MRLALIPGLSVSAVLEYVEETQGRLKADRAAGPHPGKLSVGTQSLVYVEETYGQARGGVRAASIHLREVPISRGSARRPCHNCPSDASTSDRPREPQKASGHSSVQFFRLLMRSQVEEAQIA